MSHVLMFPYPSSGHIIPLLDLSHHLAKRGLSIAFLITPPNLPLLQPLLSSHPSSIHPLILSPPEPTTGTSSPPGLSHKLLALRQLRNPVIEWFHSHPSPPVAIISDFFLGWTQELSAELGIPRLVFCPSGAFGISVYNSVWRDFPTNATDISNDDEIEDSMVTLSDVPSSPAYPWWQLYGILRSRADGQAHGKVSSENVLANLASWGTVFNSFTELERVYIEHIKKEMGHDRVWAVGPLLPPGNDVDQASERGGVSSVPAHDVLTWLDKWQNDSVVYICFGSRMAPTSQQSYALAVALEASGVPFVWCVRDGQKEHVANDERIMPEGFEDRLAERGFIIKGWAPQVPILNHRAVGMFLTHCGWNSTLEGVSAGVTMLTWPFGADQFTNAKLLVDQLGIGIRVHEGHKNIPDSAALTRILAESVSGAGLRKTRVMELRDKAKSAVNGGSSDKDLDELVRCLNELKVKM
ncbi:UDP-glucuronosyl/UDP-glucosyltransferase [Dillenia turbinata]|uniref:UDP-glucuronosyl/UDP-glucosyltransferase n=1 Tax=Dillenia turbinata TaxID=194707 RepID=A0AAN8V503_9MAGN